MSKGSRLSGACSASVCAVETAEGRKAFDTTKASVELRL